MLIPLGFLASSGAGGPTYQLLESTVLTGSQASIEFTNLTSKYGADYQHLQLRMVTRTTRAAVNDNILIRFNGDSGSNYAWHSLGANGSGVGSSAAASQSYALGGIPAGNSATTNAFYPSVTDILDAFETTKNKTLRTLTGLNESDREIGLRSAFWNNTNSLTSIELRSLNSANFVQFSRFSLYGIRSN
jgi:hypothetical protein